jgi:hypothetical protein
MPLQPRRKYRAYMKPVAKRLTMQKPERKQKVDPPNLSSDGFMRINDSKIRKVYR